MFIEPTISGYESSGEQVVRRARFLLLIQPEGSILDPEIKNAPIKAIVRKVALRQFGHWMLGRARAYGHSITVSGSYGADGLICTVPREVYDRASVELPAELRDAWNRGGGHNSAGSEAPAMRQWAQDNLADLER